MDRLVCLDLDEVVAAVIAFIGAVVYGGEAVARNRKSRLI